MAHNVSQVFGRTIITALIALSAVAGLLVRAQVFEPPPAASPNNGLLNDLTNLESFLKINVGAIEQTVSSPLSIGSSLDAGSWVGTDTYPASIVGGSAQAAPVSPPSLASIGFANAAVYGYSQSTARSIGAYGYAQHALGISAVGVEGRVVAIGGTAGKFWGQNSIAGDLYVEDRIATPHVSLSGALAADPLYTSSNGISIQGALQNGAYGSAFGGTLTSYGIYGQSVSISTDPAFAAGIYAVNTVTDSSFQPSTIYGVLGTTADLTGAAGVYGLSASGNGAEAIVGPASVEAAAEGLATAATGRGVYGNGGGWAGYFEGDMKLDSGYVLYLNDVGIDEATLTALLQWCNLGGKTFCPDPYQ